MIPNDRRYLETHEWAKVDGDVVIVGITDFAVKQLTDLVFIDLPGVGDSIQKGERFGEVESVKAVSDLNAPISGEVVEVNEGIADALETVTSDPFEAGWLIKVRPTDTSEVDALLDDAGYRKVTEEAAH